MLFASMARKAAMLALAGGSALALSACAYVERDRPSTPNPQATVVVPSAPSAAVVTPVPSSPTIMVR